ncbi:MAG: hypothetical protein V1926_03650 [Candidatus Peregrinibacteria bacterium]
MAQTDPPETPDDEDASPINLEQWKRDYGDLAKLPVRDATRIARVLKLVRENAPRVIVAAIDAHENDPEMHQILEKLRDIHAGHRFSEAEEENDRQYVIWVFHVLNGYKIPLTRILMMHYGIPSVVLTGDDLDEISAIDFVDKKTMVRVSVDAAPPEVDFEISMNVVGNDIKGTLVADGDQWYVRVGKGEQYRFSEAAMRNEKLMTRAALSQDRKIIATIYGNEIVDFRLQEEERESTQVA